jgi:hypothetical protein
VAKGQDIFATKQLTIISNKTIDKSIFGVPGYASTGASAQQLAILSSEYNVISSGIVGMKVNERKRIAIPSDNMMKNEFSVEQLALSKINLTDISIGDNFFMGVSDTTEKVTNTTKANAFLRIGEVTEKSRDGVVVDLNYPTIEVRVVSINNQ